MGMVAHKIRWDTIYDTVYIQAPAGTSTAKSGTFRLVKFGGFAGGELFFHDTNPVGDEIMVPLFQVRYARVKAT
jgi:hypothetical protein